MYRVFILKEVTGSACNFIKKETPTQVFSCESGKVLTNTFLTILSGKNFVLLNSVK